MKNIFLLLSGSLFIHAAISQTLQTKISRYVMPKTNGAEKILVLKMPYASFTIEAIIGDTVAFKNAGELLVDVICTDYPTDQSLALLNANRVKEFLKTFPFIQPAQINKLTCYRQTGGDEKEKALPMFHGVVVRYRPAQNTATVKNDLAKMNELLAWYEKRKMKLSTAPALSGDEIPGKKAIDSNSKPPYYDPSMSLKGKKITYIIGDEAYLKSRFSIPDSQKIVSFKTAYKKDLVTKRVYQQFKDRPRSYLTLYVPLAEEIQEDNSDAIKDTIDHTPAPTLTDSTILQVLKRNHWTNTAVVADVTGSMYPYSSQLLIWLQLHSTDSLSNRYCFFNDGDEKEDAEKKPGKTGGIYLQQCNSYDEVKTLLTQTMLKGSGGDFPENNIEALLAAEEQFPDAASLVLIADNWADIRDKELMSQLTKPVKIILCAVKGNRVNTDYLNLALKTNGSLHLLEQDITNLSALHNGEILNIGKTNYAIRNGLFVELDINGDPVKEF